MSVKVVSVHFPKGAGSSLAQSFIAAFGPDAVYLDYSDDPVDPCSRFNIDPDDSFEQARGTSMDPKIKVVHGHFHPAKYRCVEGAKRITFLRHPIDNLISIYFFWKTCTDPGHALFDYVRTRDLSLLDVARLPAIRYLLSRTYFGGVDIRAFDFVGFFETYSEDLKTLSDMLNVPLQEARTNKNKYPNYADEVAAVMSDKRTMSLLNDYLREDIRFYEWVRSIRQPRSALAS
jgi:hypothetical protein